MLPKAPLNIYIYIIYISFMEYKHWIILDLKFWFYHVDKLGSMVFTERILDLFLSENTVNSCKKNIYIYVCLVFRNKILYINHMI